MLAVQKRPEGHQSGGDGRLHPTFLHLGVVHERQVDHCLPRTLLQLCHPNLVPPRFLGALPEELCEGAHLKVVGRRCSGIAVVVAPAATAAPNVAAAATATAAATAAADCEDVRLSALVACLGTTGAAVLCIAREYE